MNLHRKTIRALGEHIRTMCCNESHVTATCFALFVLFACTAVQAQTLRRPTPASGSGTGTTATHTLRSTVGQRAIGRTTTASNAQGIGFWYRDHRGGTTVAVPATEGEIGTTVTIPVMLTSSVGLVSYGPRNFTIKLRYNNTILFYEGPFNVTRIGSESIVTITGTARDSFGVLAELVFTVMLGNAERTDLIIDTVEWEGATSLATERVHGSFQALGICREGDTIRLIRRQNPTAIAGVSPQPAEDNVDVGLLLGYDGPMSLHVIDVAGRTVATLVYDMNAKSGLSNVRYDISEIASGTYYLVLQTPEQLHTASLVIRK